MSEDTIGQAYTGYWEAYDLHEDPFAEVDHNYTSSHWHEYLELLQHLSLYSNVMLAVAGEEDTGRSIFLNQFRTKINIHIDTHFIKADAYFDHNALLDTIVDAYNFAGIGSNSSDFSDRATSLLTNIERSEKSVLIVIENAHLLSASTLEAMLFFIKEQPADNALLHIVLFGDLELQSKLANLEQQTDSENFVHSLELELCSPEETERYLRHKVNQAGTEAVFPFSNQDVLQVHKLSEGYFKRIDRFARDLLLERSSKEGASSASVGSKAKIFSTSLVLIAIVATGLGWYQLHKLGSPTAKSGDSTAFIPKQISSLTSQVSNQFKGWLSGSKSTQSEKAELPKADKEPSKLADLLSDEKSSVTTVAAATQHNDSVLDTVEKLKVKRAEKEAVIASNEALMKKRLEELLRENEPASKTKGSAKSKRVVKKHTKHKTLKVAKADTTTLQQNHPAAKLTKAAKKRARLDKKAAEQRKLQARIEHERAEQRKLLVSREDAFSADDIAEYDKELARLKQAAKLENPEEAAVIDSVISVPNVKQVKTSKQVAVEHAKPKTLGDFLAQQEKLKVDAKATAKHAVNAKPVVAKQLTKAQRKQLIETGSFRSRAHARRKAAEEAKAERIAAKRQLPKAIAKQIAEIKVSQGAKAIRKAPSIAKQVSHSSSGLSFSGNEYSLQLVGGHTRRNVESFVRKHSLKDSHIVKSQRAGKTWYIVMYGQYQSFDQAKGAIKQLPTVIQKMNPWIRATKAIKHS